jgi:hypothetical protein
MRSQSSSCVNSGAVTMLRHSKNCGPLFDSRSACLLVSLLAFACAGCSNDEGTLSDAANANRGQADQSGNADIAEAPAVDAAGRQPATVEDAARVLELSTFPLLAGVKDSPGRVVASLSYRAEGDPQSGFEFQRKQLLKRKFKELPNGYSSAESASGQFVRDSFHVSVSVSAAEPGLINVFIHNHGNVDLAKLPVPPGAKLQHAFPGVASFVTDAPVEETSTTVKSLLLSEGWQPYGSAGDSMYFKQNAVKLDARVLAPPAQPGKTVIDFTAAQLSADLPVPADAESVQYADQLKQVNVEIASTPEQVIEFYRETLRKAGWKATTEHPIRDHGEQMLIFRNPGEEMLTLKIKEIDGRSRYSLQHLSRAEIEELDRQFEEFKKKQKERESADTSSDEETGNEEPGKTDEP